jgi:UPF0755 protein
MKKILIIIICGVILLYINTTQNTIYHVKSGSNISIIATELKQQGIIKSENWFKLLAKVQKIEPKSGYYEINNIWQFLTDTHNAKVKTGNITLIPSKTVREYYQQMQDNPYITTQLNLAQIMQELNIPKPYEGRFFADTFKFNYGDSALSILQRSYELMQQKLQTIWKNRYKNQYIKTPYELIILASMIEKESGNEAEKATIAGVFLNRLKKNMRLQSDPTTIYALGENYTGKLTKQDLKINHPYNTYKIKGLPTGAIANVNSSSLMAASKPEKHNFYYFVAKNPKEHIFATTYAEHRKNIAKYLRK